MNQCILLSHLFVRDGEFDKLDQIHFTLKHYRQHNPDAYIILTGHGLYPEKAQKYCDHIYWPYQIIENEINVGHPYLVNAGIDHAIRMGFSHIFKCRSDGIILRDNIVEYCISKIQDKKILLTQQTKYDPIHAGDLFMYGDSHFMKKCWNIASWYPTDTGLTSFANNIIMVCGSSRNHWKECLHQNAAFVDIFNIKWIDFRANWHILQHYKDNMLDNNMNDYLPFLWGTREGWHVFNNDGQLISSNIGNMLTERVFYENNCA